MPACTASQTTPQQLVQKPAHAPRKVFRENWILPLTLETRNILQVLCRQSQGKCEQLHNFDTYFHASVKPMMHRKCLNASSLSLVFSPSFPLSFSASLGLPVCLSAVFLTVHLPGCPFPYLSACLSVSPPFSPCLCPNLSSYIYLFSPCVSLPPRWRLLARLQVPCSMKTEIASSIWTYIKIRNQLHCQQLRNVTSGELRA
jgi:hypothetical protein